MASDDVIELGSSDEEAEPAPKKMKPVPNAMVHIPSKLHGVTIKPAKSNFNPNFRIIPIKSSPNRVEALLNPARDLNKSKKPLLRKVFQKPIAVQNSPIINPISIMKKLNTSQVQINKIQLNPIHINPAKIQPILPPGITIKKTKGNVQSSKVINNKRTISKRVYNKTIPYKGIPGDMLTVELDDDEVTAPSVSSQWYIKPEDQNDMKSLEEKNNAEPEPQKLIEITIEDSPVKLVNKHTHVGSEIPIVIEDSPVKVMADKTVDDNNSDDERALDNKVPHSKKKLDYEKKSGAKIEIEIGPMHIEVNEDIANKYIDKINDCIAIKDKDVLDSSQKDSTDKLTVLSKETESSKIVENQISNTSGEFQPVYQSFIDLCFELENSEDMNKIVEKKIKTYYRQVPKQYTESEEFTEMVSSKIISMKAAPEKMYLYIKDIVDELNLQRKMAKTDPTHSKTSNDKEPVGETTEYDTKRQRQIRKLEKTLKKLHRAIQKLEEQEVDFDDDEDSVYLLTERYKERMVRVHAKFCQLTNTKMPSEPYIHIEPRPGQALGPIKKLEKWINKKVPIGTPLPFPDFHDVLRCVRQANDEDKLGWNEADIMEQARDLFTRCGKKLQRRRQENEWRAAVSRVATNEDPAESNESLKKQLELNKKLAANNEIEVLNKYADRQKLLKLEAEEIGDKEAEESPEESEEDESENSSSLEDKEKRKNRLRRLLQEKSKSKIIPEKKEASVSKVLETEGGKKSEESNKYDEENTLLKDGDVKFLENKKSKVELSSNNKTDVESVTSNVESNDKIASEDIQIVNSISDDSNKVDSDVDELHLLQKLHSENEGGEDSQETSGSESPIAISDTLESNSETDNKVEVESDVISIENSSYSESEINDKVMGVTQKLSVNTVVKCSPPDKKKMKRDNQNDELMEVVESSDENISELVKPTSDKTLHENITESTLCNKSKDSCEKSNEVDLTDDKTIEKDALNNSQRNAVNGAHILNNNLNNDNEASLASVTVDNSNIKTDVNGVSSVETVSTNDTQDENEANDVSSLESVVNHNSDIKNDVNNSSSMESKTFNNVYMPKNNGIKSAENFNSNNNMRNEINEVSSVESEPFECEVKSNNDGDLISINSTEDIANSPNCDIEKFVELNSVESKDSIDDSNENSRTDLSNIAKRCLQEQSDNSSVESVKLLSIDTVVETVRERKKLVNANKSSIIPMDIDIYEDNCSTEKMHQNQTNNTNKSPEKTDDCSSVESLKLLVESNYDIALHNKNNDIDNEFPKMYRNEGETNSNLVGCVVNRNSINKSDTEQSKNMMAELSGDSKDDHRNITNFFEINMNNAENKELELKSTQSLSLDDIEEQSTLEVLERLNSVINDSLKPNEEVEQKTNISPPSDMTIMLQKI